MNAPFSFAVYGARGHHDTAHWFPELHRRGTRGLVVHYTLGLVGEIGEVEEAIFVTREHGAVADELADVLIYTADLAYALGLDIDTRLAGYVEVDPVMILVGRLVNAVKKLNRANPFVPADVDDALDCCRQAVAIPLTALARRTLTICRQFDVDPAAAIDAKRAVLVERWGAVPHPAGVSGPELTP